MGTFGNLGTGQHFSFAVRITLILVNRGHWRDMAKERGFSSRFRCAVLLLFLTYSVASRDACVGTPRGACPSCKPWSHNSWGKVQPPSQTDDHLNWGPLTVDTSSLDLLLLCWWANSRCPYSICQPAPQPTAHLQPRALSSGLARVDTAHPRYLILLLSLLLSVSPPPSLALPASQRYFLLVQQLWTICGLGKPVNSLYPVGCNHMYSKNLSISSFLQIGEIIIP